MASGMEMMIQSAVMNMLPKLIEKLPPEVAATIGQIGQTVAGFKSQMDRIENNQNRILAALNIPPEHDTQILGLQNGRSEE